MKVEGKTIEKNLYELFHHVAENDISDLTQLNTICYCHSETSAWPNMAYAISPSIDQHDLSTLTEHIIQNKAPRTFLISEELLNENVEKSLTTFRYLPAGRWINMFATLNESVTGVPEQTEIVEVLSDDLKKIDTWVEIVSSVLFNKKPLNRDLFIEGMHNGNFKLFLTSVNDIGICTGLLYLGSEEPGIYMIATHPNYRKQGYAKRLMQVIMKHVYQLNKRSVILQSTSEGAPLYQSLGFQPAGYLFLYYSIIK